MSPSRHTLLSFAAICAFAQSPANYHDPQGRYTLRIPSGWATVQMNSDAVQFSSGTAYVTMLVLPGGDAETTLKNIGNATAKQWKNFTEARRGPAKFGGRGGQYVTWSGINPMGADAYLQMLATADGPVTYLLMTSAPKTDFTRMKPAMDQIEQSFTLTAGANVSDVPPPAPAGAVGTPKSRPSTAPPAAAASPKAPAPVSAPAGGGNVYRMKLAKIVDERGFEQPMTALTILVPTDWQFHGSVVYAQAVGCHANLVKLVLRASSPDGRLDRKSTRLNSSHP
jgi:hypothetical protein